MSLGEAGAHLEPKRLAKTGSGEERGKRKLEGAHCVSDLPNGYFSSRQEGGYPGWGYLGGLLQRQESEVAVLWMVGVEGDERILDLAVEDVEVV